MVTLGWGAHFAPLGFFGGETNFGALSGTNLENAICVPSGDHERPRGERSKFVSLLNTFVFNQNTNISDPFSVPLVKAIRVPSGDQVGFDSFTSRLVNFW